MIKDFNTYINEDYFSKLANRKDNGNVRMENEITEDFVRSFFGEDWASASTQCYINIRKENGKPVVDIDGTFYLRKDVEEIPFQFGKVNGSFRCDYGNLKSLKNCPTYVSGNFTCACCNNLTSLEGAPQEIGGHFYCYDCPGLTTLEGSPKKVHGLFSCRVCENLKSLKGSPEYVGKSFICDGCEKLTSLEGCPKKIGEDFHCNNCGSLFTRKNLESLHVDFRNIYS